MYELKIEGSRGGTLVTTGKNIGSSVGDMSAKLVDY